MKLEHQVVSLPLAKRLKELGVKQESAFSWFEIEDEDSCMGNTFVELNQQGMTVGALVDQDAAFTVAELGEMLKGFAMPIWNGGKGWDCSVSRHTEALDYEATEADARSKMLVHLIENKLVTP